MTVTQITDHQEQAFGDLSPAIAKGFNEAEARLIGDRFQALENLFFQLLQDRSLATAEGEQLDRLGELFGLQRLGLSDEQYRIALSVQVSIARSSGKREEIISAIVALLPVLEGILALPEASRAAAITNTTLRIIQTPQAKYFLQVETDDWAPTSNDVARLEVALPQLSAAGVGNRLTYPTAAGTSFRFSTDGGPQDSTRGFGDLESSDHGTWVSTTASLT